MSVMRSISLTIKIILSVQDNFCQTFATVIASEQVEDQVKEMNENNLAMEEVPTVQNTKLIVKNTSFSSNNYGLRY
jgi:hypothetical protein